MSMVVQCEGYSKTSTVVQAQKDGTGGRRTQLKSRNEPVRPDPGTIIRLMESPSPDGFCGAGLLVCSADLRPWVPMRLASPRPGQVAIPGSGRARGSCRCRMIAGTGSGLGVQRRAPVLTSPNSAREGKKLYLKLPPPEARLRVLQGVFFFFGVAEKAWARARWNSQTWWGRANAFREISTSAGPWGLGTWAQSLKCDLPMLEGPSCVAGRPPPNASGVRRS